MVVPILSHILSNKSREISASADLCAGCALTSFSQTDDKRFDRPPTPLPTASVMPPSPVSTVTPLWNQGMYGTRANDGLYTCMHKIVFVLGRKRIRVTCQCDYCNPPPPQRPKTRSSDTTKTYPGQPFLPQQAPHKDPKKGRGTAEKGLTKEDKSGHGEDTWQIHGGHRANKNKQSSGQGKTRTKAEKQGDTVQTHWGTAKAYRGQFFLLSVWGKIEIYSTIWSLSSLLMKVTKPWNFQKLWPHLGPLAWMPHSDRVSFHPNAAMRDLTWRRLRRLLLLEEL